MSNQTQAKEEALREAMVRLAVVENARVRKTWGYHTRAVAKQNSQNGAKGGRPKKVKLFRPLTAKSRMVNKMLQAGLNCVEIANVLDKSPEAVRDMKTRYDLPRDED